jgi:hypothetical protein
VSYLLSCLEQKLPIIDQSDRILLHARIFINAGQIFLIQKTLKTVKTTAVVTSPIDGFAFISSKCPAAGGSVHPAVEQRSDLAPSGLIPFFIYGQFATTPIERVKPVPLFAFSFIQLDESKCKFLAPVNTYFGDFAASEK